MASPRKDADRREVQHLFLDAIVIVDAFHDGRARLAGQHVDAHRRLVFGLAVYAFFIPHFFCAC